LILPCRSLTPEKLAQSSNIVSCSIAKLDILDFEHQRGRKGQNLGVTRLTKMTAVLAVLTFPTGFLFFFGFINVDEVPVLHVLFPFGVIFLGMFLILHTLEKHAAEYDAERLQNRIFNEAVAESLAANRCGSNSGPKEQQHKEGKTNASAHIKLASAAR
jgi:hypothetical protein